MSFPLTSRPLTTMVWGTPSLTTRVRSPSLEMAKVVMGISKDAAAAWLTNTGNSTSDSVTNNVDSFLIYVNIFISPLTHLVEKCYTVFLLSCRISPAINPMHTFHCCFRRAIFFVPSFSFFIISRVGQYKQL